MNKGELKRRAILLERELQTTSCQSPDVAAFAAYEPMLDAISRAKAGEITEPEDIAGMRYLIYETGIFWNFKALGEAFARFDLLLSGLEI